MIEVDGALHELAAKRKNDAIKERFVESRDDLVLRRIDASRDIQEQLDEILEEFEDLM